MSIVNFFALFGAGILTFASPCVLPLLPMYLAVLSGAQGQADDPRAKQRLRLAGLGFAVGLGLVFVVLGMGASAVASTLSQHRRTIEISAGILMLLFGAKLLGVLRVPWLEREARPFLQRVPNIGGFGGGLLFGAAFAVGWTPCVGPVLGAALTYAATSTANPLVAGGMLAAYALGLATPLVAASFAASKLLVLTRKLRAYTPVMQRTTGALMIVLGGLLSTDTLSLLSPSVQAEATCAGKSAACASIPKSDDGVASTVEELPRGPALVEFVSGHCTVCKKMQPIVNEFEQRCPVGMIARINVDDATGRALAAHYGVTHVPTFVSIDAAGAEVQRIVGEQSKQRLAVALREIRGVPCEVML